jgi:4-hydroxy-tetrahydrodipicolinate synthase
MKTSNRLTGVVPPVVTPLHADRSLDVESYERVLNRLIESGVDGLFILGSTSEVAFCTNSMRERVVAEAVRIVEGRVPILAGVIETQTARVLECIKAAQDHGVDGVVATAPFYAVTHLPQIRKHFELLGAAAEVPVYAYDIPVCVHTKLDPDMLVELGSGGALAGVKDSSNDDVSFRRLALKNRQAGEPLTLFTGHEFVVDGAYLAGAHGCVPGLANVDPAGYVRLHQACRDGDWDSARHEQDRLAELMEICLSPRGISGWGAGVGAFKTALMLQGLISSNQVPEPFDALTGSDIDAVKTILDRCGPRC